MKKFCCIFLVMLILCGCSSNAGNESTSDQDETSEKTQEEERTQLRVLCPTGAPSFAFANEVLTNDQIEFVDGTDLLQTAFVNKEYDVIVAPSNLGAAMSSKGASEYKLAAILTWGNLYVIGQNEEALKEGKLAAFGEAAVPGKVWNTVKENLEIEFTEEFYNSAADVQTALISGNYQVGLIAEPAATATIAKAKEAGIELSVLADLQELWKDATGFEGGYPQAAIFVLEERIQADPKSYEALFEGIKEYCEKISDSDKSQLISDLDQTGVEKFGLASSAMAAKTWDKMNIRFAYAKENEENLQAFLKLFGIEEAENLILK